MRAEISGITDAFFRAMEAGWAQEASTVSIPQFPGSKVISFQHGPYRVLDTYFESPDSHKSTGITLIWHEDVPVWVMHYHGHYAKAAIPFLKQCLLKAYATERRFYGGRGPFFVSDDGLIYMNQVTRHAPEDFEGREEIYDSARQSLGYHWYRGGSLTEC